MALSYEQGVALLRVAFGLYFLSSAVDKLRGGWLSNPQPMSQVAGGFVQRNQVEPLYRPFLEGVVLPNASTFAQMVTFTELFIAVSLILGLFTRLGALGAIWLTANFMLMKGLLNNAGSSDRLFMLAAIVFFLSAAGLVWGLDGRLRDMLAINRFTRWVTGLSSPPPKPHGGPSPSYR